MIGEEGALILSPRKRERLWNGYGLLFLQVFFTLFHFTHYLALFVLHFTVLMQKIKKPVAGASDGGKKETKQIE